MIYRGKISNVLLVWQNSPILLLTDQRRGGFQSLCILGNLFIVDMNYSFWWATAFSHPSRSEWSHQSWCPVLRLVLEMSMTWLCTVFFPQHTQHSEQRGRTTPSKGNQNSFTRLPPGPELEDHVVGRCHWPSFSSWKELSCGWNQW